MRRVRGEGRSLTFADMVTAVTCNLDLTHVVEIRFDSYESNIHQMTHVGVAPASGARGDIVVEG